MARQSTLLGNLLLATFSVLVALYLLELLVRVVTPAPPKLVHVDWLAEIEARRAGRNDPTYTPALPPRSSSTDSVGNGDAALMPLGSVSSARIILCANRRTGEIVEYDSDERGFRNPMGTWAARPAVVLIGDSYAHGYCVGEGDDIAGQLRTLGYPVLNLGQSASGPLTALATVVEYVQPIQPASVFWLYYEGNDLRNLREDQKVVSLRSYLAGTSAGDTESAAGQGLFDRQSEVDALLREFFEAHFRRLQAERAEMSGVAQPAADSGDGGDGPMAYLKLWRLRQRLGLTRTRPYLPKASAHELAEVVAHAAGVIDGWDGRLTVVYLPAHQRYRFASRADRQFDRPGVLAAFDSIGVPVLDLTDDFRSVPDRAALFDPGTGNHYTPQGYRLVAEAIAGWLDESGGQSGPP